MPATATGRAQQSIFNGVYAPFNGIGYVRASIGTDKWEAGIFSDNVGNTVGPLNRPGGQNQIVYPRTIGISLEGKFKRRAPASQRVSTGGTP